MTEWRPIPSKPGCEASSEGEARRDGKVLKQVLQPDGYLRVLGGGMKRPVHRYIAEAFFGSIPDGMVVNHLDGNKANNRIANLEVCTKRENEQHASRMGLMAFGERNGSAVLTEDMVRRIVATYKAGICGQKRTATLLGLKKYQVQFVVEGRVWNWLTGIKPKRFPRASRAKRRTVSCS